MDKSLLVWPTSSKSYTLVAPIGTGSFGFVWKADVIEGCNLNKSVAIKIIDLE